MVTAEIVLRLALAPSLLLLQQAVPSRPSPPFPGHVWLWHGSQGTATGRVGAELLCIVVWK